MTCSLTKLLDQELKSLLSRDEYCSYDSVLNALYQASKEDRKDGNLLNEIAFKDLLSFYCVLMFKILHFTTRNQRGGGLKQQAFIIYFLLSGYIFYNSYQNFSDAITIPESLLSYVEQYHPESERTFSKLGRNVLSKQKKSRGFNSIFHYLRPAKEILEIIHKFISKTLSEIAEKDYVKALYDSTYTSAAQCRMRDFNLIFTKKNLMTLISRVDVLMDHQQEILTLYHNKYPFVGTTINENTYLDAGDAQLDFDKAMTLALDAQGIESYKSSCMITTIKEKEKVAKSKKNDKLNKKIGDWVSSIKSAKTMVQILFCNIIIAGILLASSFTKVGKEYNATKNNLNKPLSANKTAKRHVDVSALKPVSAVKTVSTVKPLRTLVSPIEQPKRGVFNAFSRTGEMIRKTIRRIPYLVNAQATETVRVNPILKNEPVENNTPVNGFIIPEMPVTGFTQTHIKKNRYGTRIIYEKGENKEMLISDLVSGKYKNLLRSIVYLGKEEATPNLLFRYNGQPFKLININGSFALTNHGLMYQYDENYILKNGDFIKFQGPYEIFETISIDDYFSYYRIMKDIVYIGEDRQNPGRLLFRFRFYSGPHHNFIGQKGPLYDLNKQPSGASLSKDGALLFTKYDTHRGRLRYEEDNIRYLFDNGYFMMMNPYYQAEPTKPIRGTSREIESWMREYDIWKKDHKHIYEEVTHLEKGVDLLREDHHLVEHGQFLQVITPNHVPGYMDAYKMRSQADYIESKIKQGWEYDADHKLLNWNEKKVTSVKLSEDALLREREQQLWRQEDMLQAKYVEGEKKWKEESTKQYENFKYDSAIAKAMLSASRY